MVLGFARRDQGEISFAIDRTGALYTSESNDKPRLQSLGVERTALVAAEGTPRRTGDWIIVARRAPAGIIFGIARPIGESLREIRRASVRNLGFGMLVIALAFIGIVPISHRMTQHLATLTSGVRQLAGGDFHTRVPVRSKDEFGALAGAFNQMAEDLERHEAAAVEQERLRRELELSRLIQTEMLPRGPLRVRAGRNRRRFDSRPAGRRRLLQLLRASGWPACPARRRRLRQGRQRRAVDGEHPGNAASAAAARDRPRPACRSARSRAGSEHTGRRVPDLVPGASSRPTAACCAT